MPTDEPPTAGQPDDLDAHDAEQDADRIRSRSALLPEEAAVGSDDPEAQAKVILEDSELRTEDPGAAPTTFLEHRRSDQTL